ncbi:MAG: DUF3109 family protein [Bacteroidetes bacterium]|nr:DUF3109 family protein [Bacteroidota bacterium]MBL6942797.1 DUF3109 family protein [Bacteroidales bacterium]
MIIIDDILVSDEIKEIYFACNLHACKGDCCVAGDAGAPLDEEEISILEDDIDYIKPFMTKQGLEIIERGGVFEYDTDGEYVTPLVNDNECAFVYFENSISFCSIEKAYIEGKTEFQKPVSCHLYPIRLSKVGLSIAVNYHRWHICSPALNGGTKNGVPLYRYLKQPLIRKFGEPWFDKLIEQFEKTPIS